MGCVEGNPLPAGFMADARLDHSLDLCALSQPPSFTAFAHIYILVLIHSQQTLSHWILNSFATWKEISYRSTVSNELPILARIAVMIDHASLVSFFANAGSSMVLTHRPAQ